MNKYQDEEFRKIQDRILASVKRDTKLVTPPIKSNLTEQKHQLAKILASEQMRLGVQNATLEIAHDPKTSLGAAILRETMASEKMREIIQGVALELALDPTTSLGALLLQSYEARLDGAGDRQHSEALVMSGFNESADFGAIFDHFDAKLDAFSCNDNIIPAPPTSNPLLIASGTVLLQTSSSLSSLETDAGQAAYFVVHKAIFAHHSLNFVARTYTRPKEDATVYRVDADKHILERFVSWLYHPKDFDLTRLTADVLLGLICISIDLHIAKLHNAVVSILITRHTGLKNINRCPRKFKPSKASVSLVYAKTQNEDGARMLCAYLLVLSGTFEIDKSVDWERKVEDDMQIWLEEGRLNGWVTLSDCEFFMGTGKDRRKWKEPQKR
jgi:hypothetical protein